MGNLNVFGFSGQGSQAVGMGQELIAQRPDLKSYYDQASKILDWDLYELCMQGPAEKLAKTEYTQPALFVTDYVQFLAQSEKPDFVLGHSLGEYPALCAAEVFSFADGVAIVKCRARLMEKAVPAGIGGMAAVIGIDLKKIEEIIKTEKDVVVANYNSWEQVVISGAKQSVISAQEKLSQTGAKVIPLNVSGPFHSPLMAQAGPEFAEFLKTINFSKPKFPFISNVTANQEDNPEKIKELLVQQLYSSVLWVQSIDKILNLGSEVNFIEIGPGSVLKGLFRKINKKVSVK